MNPISEKIAKLQSLKTLNNRIKDFVLENENDIVSLNQNQLFDKGIKADNKAVLPNDFKPSELINGYRPSTVKAKRAKGQRVDHVTLKDSGNFYKSFELIVGSDRFEIIAKDSKTDRLQKRYQPEILGLTEDSIIALRAKLKTYLLNVIRRD